MSLIVLFYDTNFMNTLKLCDFFKTSIFYILLNHPTFHSEERLVNLVKGRECFVGLSILLVYGEKIYHIQPLLFFVSSVKALARTIEEESDRSKDKRSSLMIGERNCF